MRIKSVDKHFSTAGQIRPEEIEGLAEKGYTAIVCARPDNEEPGQPAFAEIAREAAKHGMKAVQIPIAGKPSSEQIAQFEKEMSDVEGPVLSYCRSGARAASLYASIKR